MDKKKLAALWLKKYPEQAHFEYDLIQHWLEDYAPIQRRIIEIGGWRGIWHVEH